MLDEFEIKNPEKNLLNPCHPRAAISYILPFSTTETWRVYKSKEATQ